MVELTRKSIMSKYHNLVSRYFPVLILCVLLLTSCATPKTKLGKGIILEPSSKIEIGSVTSANNTRYEVDAEKMLREELEKALQEEEILWSKTTNEKYYTLSLEIQDYEMGNAFKRWLLPGYGSTILKVLCELNDDVKGVNIDKFEHKRSIVVGGLYTVGGWKTIFQMVAKDIAFDLKRIIIGKVQAFFVELDPWPENETDIPKTKISKKINLVPLKDNRPEKGRIGERYAAFNASMGDVYFRRNVADYLYEAIQNDLVASGNKLTISDNDFKLEGKVKKFWISTNTTPLYWDVIGEIEIELIATLSTGSMKKINKTYLAQSSSRTYVWPTEKFLSQVLSESVKTLMNDIRNDSIWLKIK